MLVMIPDLHISSDHHFIDDDCIIIESEGPSTKYRHTDLHPLAFERSLPKYSEETILNILLDPNLDQSRICSVWPVNVKSSSTFVIDISKLSHPDDVKKDNFGKWKHSGSHQTPYHITFRKDSEIDLEKYAHQILHFGVS